MSNELLNWHVRAGEPFGTDCTLADLADEAGNILDQVDRLANVIGGCGIDCLAVLPFDLQIAITIYIRVIGISNSVLKIGEGSKSFPPLYFILF